MPIGKTLAEARRQAGLTVTDVSERTRIRESIIRAIEDDDYSSCGGDFYARGNIRSIAKVVGTDSKPLVQEYDAVYGTGAFQTVSLDELMSASDEAPRRRGPDVSGTGERPAASGAPWWHWLSGAADLVVVAFTTVRLWLSRSAAGQAARSVSSALGRRLNWLVVLGVTLAVALGFGVYRFLASPQQTPVAPSAASKHAVTDHDATHARPNPAPKASHVAVAPAPAAAVPGRRLTPVSVAAFGPGGGDDPQNADLAVGGQPGNGWRSDWYTSAHFGNLYGGTGLILDMGRLVTITAVQIALGQARGATVQLRVGAAPALADMRRVARAGGAGGVVRLRLARPARGRFVLIWFTRLPPDPVGTFEVEVWNVRVEGQR